MGQALVIERCFLSQRAEPCHALRILDPASGADDIVYIGDEAWQLMCDGDDQVAGELWRGFKEATSSGYTDAGLVDLIIRAADIKGVQPFILEARPAEDAAPRTYFAVLYQWETGVGVLCRSARAVPPSLARSAEPYLDRVAYDAAPSWIGGTDLPVFVKADRLEPIAVPTLAMAVWGQGTTRFEGGYPFWQSLCSDETRAGFELMRRFLV